MKHKVKEALREVQVPGRGGNIIDLNLLGDVIVSEGASGVKLALTLVVDPQDARNFEPLRRQVEGVVGQMDGVESVTAVLTAHKQAASQPESDKLLRNVRNIIAVASGKGGVGKSTTAVNLAMAMAGRGLKTGLLDADIYGPSIPRMLGMRGEPELNDDDKLVPYKVHNLSVMSIGNLIPEEAPVVWRGPMVHSALRQLLSDVAWNDLDVMLIDMPPGTGDAPLTLAHLVALSGAIIVSTPQDIALLDARKAIGLFNKLNIPVLGVIENMSQFVCPHCGGQSEIFGHGGARLEASRLNIPFLGEVPIDLRIRTTSDNGTPIVVVDSGHACSEVYAQIAIDVMKRFDR